MHLVTDSLRSVDRVTSFKTITGVLAGTRLPRHPGTHQSNTKAEKLQQLWETPELSKLPKHTPNKCFAQYSSSQLTTAVSNAISGLDRLGDTLNKREA